MNEEFKKKEKKEIWNEWKSELSNVINEKRWYMVERFRLRLFSRFLKQFLRPHPFVRNKEMRVVHLCNIDFPP